MRLLAERFVFWRWWSSFYERGSQDLSIETNFVSYHANSFCVFTSTVYVQSKVFAHTCHLPHASYHWLPLRYWPLDFCYTGRMCPGQDVAWRIVARAVCTILKEFDLAAEHWKFSVEPDCRYPFISSPSHVRMIVRPRFSEWYTVSINLGNSLKESIRVPCVSSRVLLFSDCGQMPDQYRYPYCVQYTHNGRLVWAKIGLSKSSKISKNCVTMVSPIKCPRTLLPSITRWFEVLKYGLVQD